LVIYLCVLGSEYVLALYAAKHQQVLRDDGSDAVGRSRLNAFYFRLHAAKIKEFLIGRQHLLYVRPWNNRSPVLRMYIAQVPITRPFFDVTPQSPVQEFIAEAPQHPVFRLLD
jgi:hypothetical protein